MKRALRILGVTVVVLLFTICTRVQMQKEPFKYTIDEIKNKVKVSTIMMSGKKAHYITATEKGEKLKFHKNGKGFIDAVEVYDEEGNLIGTVTEEDIADILLDISSK